MLASSGYYPTDQVLLRVRGNDSRDYLHRVLTCNVRNLASGDARPGALLTGQGKLVAPLHLLGEADGSFSLVTPGGCAEALQLRLERYIFSEDVQVEVEEKRILHLIGNWAYPGALPEVHRFCDSDHDGLPLRLVRLAQDSALLIATVVPADLGPPLSEQDYEIWRISCGLPAWGRELTDAVIPLHLGLDDAFDHQKGCYTGQEVISRANFVGHPPHQLVGVRSPTRLRNDDELIRDGDYIGTLTSTVFVERTAQTIGLARIRWQKASPGDRLQVAEAGDVEVVALPLVGKG